MAFVYLQEFDVDPGDRSTTHYDAIAERLGDVRPDGLLIHTAGFDGDVFRILDVWESQEQAQRFTDEQLMPIVAELMANEPEGGAPQRESSYELHHIIHP